MEDFLAGIFEELFASLLLIPIGFVYLWLRFRTRIQVEKILAREYENSYANTGSVVVLNTVAASGIALVLGLIIVAPLLHWLRS